MCLLTWNVLNCLPMEVTKRCRISWLTNSALVYEPKCGGWGVGLWGLSQWVQLRTWSPNKHRRSSSIFNLWYTPKYWKKNVHSHGPFVWFGSTPPPPFPSASIGRRPLSAEGEERLRERLGLMDTLAALADGVGGNYSKANFNGVALSLGFFDP
jgi:hypothetical protein